MTRRIIHGQIGRTLGKKLESKWISVDGKRVQVEVRTQKKGEYDENYCFNAVYCHGKEDYEWARADSALDAVKELQGLLHTSLAMEWERKLYIYVSHGADSNHGFHSQYNQWGHDLSISLGVIDVGECNGETLYRKVHVRRHAGHIDEAEKNEGGWVFNPERHTSTSGPDVGHRTHFEERYGVGLIPFSVENLNKMHQVLEQLNKLGEAVKEMITGEDPLAIMASLQTLALPAPGGEEA